MCVLEGRTFSDVCHAVVPTVSELTANTERVVNEIRSIMVLFWFRLQFSFFVLLDAHDDVACLLVVGFLVVHHVTLSRLLTVRHVPIFNYEAIT